jgi:hypothetical protein
MILATFASDFPALRGRPNVGRRRVIQPLERPVEVGERYRPDRGRSPEWSGRCDTRDAHGRILEFLYHDQEGDYGTCAVDRKESGRANGNGADQRSGANHSIGSMLP